MAAAASWLARIEDAEARFCVRANRSCECRVVLAVFAVASRLGDGILWYCLMLLLPLLFGAAGLATAVQMAAAGIFGTALYRQLKERLARERPCKLNPRIRAGARPLDRYSFPSGHTLHAVAFTAIALASFPILAWVLVPFALLVAASRVILGLHYPSDVVAGAVLGLAIAKLVLFIAA